MSGEPRGARGGSRGFKRRIISELKRRRKNTVQVGGGFVSSNLTCQTDA